MKIINKRYRIIESLKRDMNGTVMLVEDLMHDAKRLRLKMFNVEFSKNVMVNKIFSEFLELKSIVHPNLLGVNSFAVVSDINGKPFNKLQYFYTFEDYNENHLVQYTALTRSEVMIVIVELFKIFRFLSFRGMTYIYLNFENLMIFKDEDRIWIKLKDLVNLIQYDEYSSFKSNANIQFLAPEIVWGDDRDEKADIYSLGAMVYYLYYREEYTTRKLERFKINMNRSEITDLIRKATSNFKEERFGSTKDMFDEVQKIFWVKYDYSDYDYYNVLNLKTSLVSHKGLLKKIIKNKNEKLSTFKSIGTLLFGERGSGKTRVLNECYQMSLFSGDFVNFYQINEDVEGNQWIDHLIASLLSRGDVPSGLIQKYGPEILKILPELAEEWDVVPSQPLGDDKENLRLINRLYNFLLEYSAVKPFILIIDDIQFMNPLEFGIINNLVKDSDGSPLYLLLSVDAIELINAYNWKHDQDICFEELRAFTLEETGLYIQKILGMDHVPYKIATPVMDESAGNPRIIEEIIRNFYLEGRLKVSKKPTWQLDEEKPIAEIEIRYDSGDANIKLVENLEEAIIEVLAKLSCMKENFSTSIYGDYIVDESRTILDRLTTFNLLNRKLRDNEYVYSFTTKNLKRHLYSKLSEDERKNYHLELAEIYEAYYEATEMNNKELVYHLTLAGKLSEASKWHMLFAKRNVEQYRYMDAIEELMEVSRLSVEVGDIEMNGDSLFFMGELYLLLGMLEEAISAFERALEYLSELEKQLECRLKIAYLEIQMNMLDQAKVHIEAVLKEAQKVSYLPAEFDAISFLSRLEYLKGDTKSYRPIVFDALERAKEHQMTFHIARLQNEKSLYEISEHDYEIALVTLNRAFTNFEIVGADNEAIKVLNNTGVLYFDAFSNLVKAREYFERCIERQKVRNLSDGMSTYLYNVGETYIYEEKYKDAVFYMNQALKYTEDTGDKNVQYPIINASAKINTLTGKFDEAAISINRLEHEYSFFKDRDLDLREYYYSQMLYFSKIKHIEMAEKWKRLYNEAIGDFDEFEFATMDFVIRYQRRNLFKQLKEIDFEQIGVLKTKIKGHQDALLLKNVILDMALELLYSRKFIIIQKLLLLEKTIKVETDTVHLSLKREVLQGFLEEDRIKYYKVIIQNDQITEELKWISHKMIADEYHATGDFYNAMRHYLMAFDIIKTITMRIPSIYREPYIVYDENKIELKSKMAELRLMLIGDANWKRDSHRVIDVNSVEDFFDMRTINELYNHPKFLQSLYDSYEGKYGKRMEGAMDMLRLFEEDAVQNFRLILQYLEQITISEKGFIYLYDEHGDVVEVIKSEMSVTPPDLNQFIKNVANLDEGIVVNSLHADDYFLMEHQKGVIAFPILASDTKVRRMIENRKSDGQVYKEKALGYVYLETGSIFNNFSMDAFNICKDLIPMLRDMITSHNLRRVSTVDKLTTVYLRKYIEELFSEELYKARYDGTSLSVIMCDIDKFKSVNDTYGHRMGDEVLNRIGKTLKGLLRNTDLVGRYGGEEFILILPKTDKHDAFEVSEKIRNTIMRANLLANDTPVTMSFGLSTYPEDGQNEEELIEKADKSLYYSKNSGRNRTTLWNKNLLMKNERFDKLAGILSGNLSGDARNVQAIIDLFSLLKNSGSFETKILNLLTTVMDITESKSASILLGDDFGRIYTKIRGKRELSEQLHIDSLLLDEYMNMDDGTYFINWDDLSEVHEDTGNPNWNSIIFTPLIRNGKKVGMLILTVPIHEKEFDFNTFNFVDVLSGVIGSIIEMEE